MHIYIHQTDPHHPRAHRRNASLTLLHTYTHPPILPVPTPTRIQRPRTTRLQELAPPEVLQGSSESQDVSIQTLKPIIQQGSLSKTIILQGSPIWSYGCTVRLDRTGPVSLLPFLRGVRHERASPVLRDVFCILYVCKKRALTNGSMRPLRLPTTLARDLRHDARPLSGAIMWTRQHAKSLNVFSASPSAARTSRSRNGHILCAWLAASSAA